MFNDRIPEYFLILVPCFVLSLISNSSGDSIDRDYPEYSDIIFFSTGNPFPCITNHLPKLFF